MRSKRWLWWLTGALVVIVLGVVVAPFVYIHFIEADPPSTLTFPDGSSGGVATGGIEGTWTPTSASEVGYRINEVIFGQTNVAVGRTNKVAGQLVISGTSVKSVSLTVDMTAVSSDKDQRDRQFQGRIMQTSTYPTATFELSSPIDLGKVPGNQEVVSASAQGKLTMHGTTKTVTIPIKARRNGNTLEVNGSLNIVFADWGIPNPTFGPVTTENHGLLELLVVFGRS